MESETHAKCMSPIQGKKGRKRKERNKIHMSRNCSNGCISVADPLHLGVSERTDEVSLLASQTCSVSVSLLSLANHLDFSLLLFPMGYSVQQ